MGKYLDGTGLAHFWDAFKARLLPSGGTSGQVLAKSSGTDYAVGWATPSSGGTSTWYATSSTTAATSAKVVDCTGYTLVAGSIVGILFSTANTASAPTLNINSTGAIAIYIGNTAPSGTTNVLKWSANTMVYVMYDGTYYRLLNAVSRAADNSFEGGGTWYGASSTAAGTATKASTITNFRLTIGAIVSINFSTANTVTAEAVKLNVNSTGAKTIAVTQGATSASVHLLWEAKSILTFIYDGTYWRYIGASHPPTAALPSGGTYGQVLSKRSGVDYDVVWATQTIPAVADTTTLLQGDGLGNAIAADPSSLFVIEPYVVINGVSVAAGSVAEANGYQITKSGYYPISIAGWTSSNRYPTIFGCRLIDQDVGSGTLYCGTANWTGSSRSFTITVRVLWMRCDGVIANANGVSF